MEGKVAFVFGASGLVGSNLVKELVNNPAYSQVLVVVRKPLAIVNMKVHEIALDKFEGFDLSALSLKDTQVFCCLGTTIKAAGSQEAFRKVDYELPLQIGRWAKSNGIETFILVSSIGAKATSGNFYLKTKGETEQGLMELQFQRLVVVRPSLLLGTRSEFRLGEELAKVFTGAMKFLFFGPFKKFKGINASSVAKAMVILANSQDKSGVFESDKLAEIGR